MRYGVWTPLPHTIFAEPAMDAAVAELSTPGAGRGPDPSFAFALEVLHRAEAAGFETTLIAERWQGPDLEAWMASAALAGRTTTLELMTAVHPGIVTPQAAAKMGASLDRISGGRAAVNVVNGWWEAEFNLFANGGWLGDDDGRYRRMDEYIEVMKRMWTEETFSFHGEFYHVDNGSLPIRPRQLPHPPIYAASRSPRGRETVARLCDVWFVAYEPSYGLADENIRQIEIDIVDMNRRARAHGRTLGYGISAHVICADTVAEAEAKVGALEEYGRRDRVAMVAAKALGAGLVGTPETIARRIRHYQDIGITCLMIHFHPMLEGLDRFIRDVMPLVQAPARVAVAE